VKKFYLVFAGLLGTGLLGISTAAAATYVSGNLGLVFQNDGNYYDIIDGDVGRFTFDTGFALVGALGMEFGERMRAEIELGYRSSDVDTAASTQFGSWQHARTSDITTTSFMFNGYYDFNPGAQFSPFIGGGLGFANVEGMTWYGQGDDSVLAYQFMIGGTFAVDRNMNLDFQYRYFGTTDPELAWVEIENTSHNLMVGIRYSF
jgi:opacity protein-like surface antigen